MFKSLSFRKLLLKKKKKRFKISFYSVLIPSDFKKIRGKYYLKSASFFSTYTSLGLPIKQFKSPISNKKIFMFF